AHAPNERTWKKELVDCAAMYAAIPSIYAQQYADKMPKDTENLVEIKK
ncbi:MAG: YgeY family selenium metabolism-linked hydrolase, partial [Bacillota bacterium]|nr:YgeY family selenium metabolism-linked hydrolase [Bacillota bacterium]